MLKTVNLGFGEILNDLWGKGSQLRLEHPPAPHDPEKAKSLLKPAGDHNIGIGYHRDVLPGMVEAATLYQQQVQAAGVNVNLRKVPPGPTSPGLAQLPVRSDQLPGRSTRVLLCHDAATRGPIPRRPMEGPKGIQLVEDALAETNPSNAQDKWNAWQQYVWTNGGQIHWGTGPYTEAWPRRFRRGAGRSWFITIGGAEFLKYWLE